MTTRFDPRDYAPPLSSLVDMDRCRDLTPDGPDESARDALEPLDPAEIGGDRPIADASMAAAVVSGVWLLHDFLDESHDVSQGIDTPTGSYWHGIMHRREGDYSNAKYWFRRTGDHPVFAEVAAAATELGWADWDPHGFVDACQQASAEDERMLCRRVQQLEWELLFDYSYRHAVGR